MYIFMAIWAAELIALCLFVPAITELVLIQTNICDVNHLPAMLP